MKTMTAAPAAPRHTPYPRTITAHEGTAWLTLALVAANLAIYALCSATPGSADATIDACGFSPIRLSAHLDNGDTNGVVLEGLRSVSSIFVHEYDWMHVATNMAFLLAFGFAVEKRLGRIRYALVYLVAGVGTCVAYFSICPDGRPSFGASSAVCGVLGAYIVLFVKTRFFRSLIPLAVLGLNLYGATNPAILAQTGFGMWAHIIGYALGMLMVAVLTLQLSPEGSRASH